jgi:hypothetical protein
MGTATEPFLATMDVSKLFGERGGRLFLFSVQARGIEDQTRS